MPAVTRRLTQLLQKWQLELIRHVHVDREVYFVSVCSVSSYLLLRCYRQSQPRFRRQ
jgi:hypothetical protein